ncbi:UDP-N-acetylmuramoyl-L-alanine--D-glutamate ligase [Halorhodospira abdelmalekii]|uniref:UDP-N-acetylmuramoyl-L-alanine--D-glutamate ligase n=1 Tax=Halorhodospira abdelmalekii TaxID=421629 RepID=UPI00190890B1|nr:UDP-N-acetylmuramoyl-L-alanine--D-glutamate ligase [Halorhodospira abdelmalekii]MBK1735603.1 UDP-N-acetylmuramoyl-L-alanine--D-glutamate ligase [Halorhodospira abdelmalekii]
MESGAMTGHKRYTTVAGLGATGLACVRHLRRQGVPVVVVDSRERPPQLSALQAEHPEVPVVLGGLDGEVLRAAERIVISPGLDSRQPPFAQLQAAGQPICGELELFAAAVPEGVTVAAVTGSNGKSTVVTLVAEMARAAGRRVAVGGNLGTPTLDLLAADPVADLFVLEVSSFQLEACPAFCPQIGAVLNVSPDHLDRYDGIEAYTAAKARLLEGVEVAIINADDPRVRRMGETARSRRYFSVAGVHGGTVGPASDYATRTIDGEPSLSLDGEARLAVRELALTGVVGQANALAAMAVADACELPIAAQQAVLRRFRGLPHRMERIGEWHEVAWINDSKATNVGAAVAALAGVGRPAVLIAGGQGKGGDFRPLAEACERYARAVILIGEDASAIEAALAGRVPTECASGMEQAVVQAAARAQPGDCVLLAPACASFDAFSGFEQRGARFRQAVLDVVGEVMHG